MQMILEYFNTEEGTPWMHWNFFAKSLSAEKIERGHPLVLSGLVCYAKKGTTIIVQFSKPSGTIWHLENF